MKKEKFVCGVKLDNGILWLSNGRDKSGAKLFGIDTLLTGKKGYACYPVVAKLDNELKVKELRIKFQ